ncbi:hypothetical protein HI914_01759 [Erysiphe necator]|nr:hypothetical protein HI914_01759 [Erysiphe necator]
MTEADADQRKRSAERNFVLSWLNQTNEGNLGNILNESLQRIHSHDYIQKSLKRKIKPVASFDSSIIDEPMRNNLEHDDENTEKKQSEIPDHEGLNPWKSKKTKYDPTLDKDSHQPAPFTEVAFCKRMRHKTREDRYDINKKRMIKHKPVNRTSEKSRRNLRKSNKIHKHVHSFSSKKIGADRLTLRPSNNRGIFKNGRASSPVTRRGIPDLSFSEMEFLRRSSKVSLKENGGRVQARFKNSEKSDEISAYFKASKVSIPLNNNYHLRSPNKMIRQSKSTRKSNGFSNMNIKESILCRGASIELPLHHPSKLLSPQSHSSMNNYSSSTAKVHSSLSENQHGSQNELSNFIRSDRNENFFMEPYNSFKSMTSNYQQLLNKDIVNSNEQANVTLNENMELINLINASSDEKMQQTSNITNIANTCFDAKCNMNYDVELGSKRYNEGDEIKNKNIKYVGPMNMCDSGKGMKMAQKRETVIHWNENILKNLTKPIHIKRPSTTVPILSVSPKNNFSAKKIQNHHDQIDTKLTSSHFDNFYEQEKTEISLSHSPACHLSKKTQRHDLKTFHHDRLSQFEVSKQNLNEKLIWECPFKNIENSKNPPKDEFSNRYTPEISIDKQNEIFNNFQYQSIASPNLLANIFSPGILRQKEHILEEKYQFLSQLEQSLDSNESSYFPGLFSTTNAGFTQPLPLAEDTQSTGRKQKFCDDSDQLEEQSININEKLYYYNYFNDLEVLDKGSLDYIGGENQGFQNETATDLSLLNSSEVHEKPLIATITTPYSTSRPETFEYLLQKNRAVEEHNDLGRFWDVHRGY